MPLLALLALVATSCDWLGWRYDSAHTGNNGADHSLTTSNLGKLIVRWKAHAGSAVRSSVALTHGLAIVGGEDGNVYAFDNTAAGSCYGNTPRGCVPQWYGVTNGDIDSSPTVAGDTVYIGSTDGSLYAFALRPNPGTCVGAPLKCAPEWVVHTGGAILSSPNVVGSSVYVGSEDHKLWSISTSGAVQWTATTGGGVQSSPAVADGEVFVGSDDGNVYGYDAATGAPVWQATTGGPVRSSPAIVGSRLYVGSDDHKLYAFAEDGSAGCSGSSPTVCVPLWSFTTGGRVWSSAAISGNTVVIGSEDAKLYAVNTAGAPLWSATTGGPIVASPGIAGDVVYIGSADGHVTAYDLHGVSGCSGSPTVCNPVWNADTGAPIQGSPSISSGAVSIASSDGTIWSWQMPYKPTAPAAPTASLAGTPGHVTVDWAPPEDDGGSPVTSYLLEVSTDAGAHWSTVGTIGAPATTTDHYCGASGTACQFRVSATNGVGTSPASAPSEGVAIPTLNSPPVFTLGSNQDVNADDGAQSVANFASVTSPGPLPGEKVTGFTVTNDAHGLFTAQPAIAVDGTLTFTPDPATVSGTATVSVTATNDGGTANGGQDTTTVQTFTIAVSAPNQPPTAGSPTVKTRGNTRVTVAAPGLLAGSSDPEGGAVHVCTAGTYTGSNDGSLVVAADGSYTYDPSPGSLGADTVTVAVCDTVGASTNVTLSVTVDGPEIWYVDGTAASNGTGTDQSPFNSLASASSASGNGDTIYLAASGTGANGGITLKPGVSLIGAGVALVRSPDDADIPAGTTPTITRPSSLLPIVTANGSNTISGVNIDGTGATTGATGISSLGTSGDLHIDHVAVSNLPGTGIEVDNVAGTVTLAHVTVASTAGNAIVARSNSAAAETVDITNSSVSTTMQAGNGILARSGNSFSGPSLKVTVADSAFTGIDDDADAINAATNGSTSHLDVAVTGTSFANASSGIARGDNAIRATNLGTSSTLTTDIEDDTFSGWVGTVIDVQGRADSSSLTGPGAPGPALATITGNQIGDAGDSSVVGSGTGYGIVVGLDLQTGGSSVTGQAIVSGNHVYNAFLGGISINTRHGVGANANTKLHLALSTNTIGHIVDAQRFGIILKTQDATTMCIAPNGNSSPTAVFDLEQVDGSVLHVVGDPDFGGEPGSGYVAAHNTALAVDVTGSPTLVSPNSGGCGNP